LSRIFHAHEGTTAARMTPDARSIQGQTHVLVAGASTDPALLHLFQLNEKRRKPCTAIDAQAALQCRVPITAAAAARAAGAAAAAGAGQG